MPSRSKHNGTFVVMTIMFIVLAYLAIASFGYSAKRAAPIVTASNGGETGQSFPVSVATPVYASAGAVVDGFPKSMIIDNGAKIANSYSLNYNSSLNQYTAIFNSDMAMEPLFTEYLSYFGKNGWTVTNQVTKYPTSRGIYAISGTDEASVAIVMQSQGLQVIVSYLVK